MSLKKYKHLIFDLDHTLWDFERNARETLEFLFDQYNLSSFSLKSDKEKFVQAYFRVNRQMWKLYDKNLVSKKDIRELRFKKVLDLLNIKNRDLALALEDHFLKICPSKGHLIQGTLDVLTYLNPHYQMHILTNGFIETQNIKIQTSNLSPFFDTITTSECSGYKKPNPKIFDFKLKRINARKDECLMIGDNLLTDIGGARRWGIDQMFYNPTKMKHSDKITFEITDLNQIMNLL